MEATQMAKMPLCAAVYPESEEGHDEPSPQLMCQVEYSAS